jgi:hypothetical protein
MENDSTKKPELKDFTSDYNEIIRSSENSVVVKTQWEKDGDHFQKLSMYDDTYLPVITLGGTTLINQL